MLQSHMLKYQLTFQKMKIYIPKNSTNSKIPRKIYMKYLFVEIKRRLNAPCPKARAPGLCLGPLGLENLKSTGKLLQFVKYKNLKAQIMPKLLKKYVNIKFIDWKKKRKQSRNTYSGVEGSKFILKDGSKLKMWEIHSIKRERNLQMLDWFALINIANDVVLEKLRRQISECGGEI
jgi:hypothetical protein